MVWYSEMNLKQIYKPIEKELETVEKRLMELQQSEKESISSVLSDILITGGKRLRPALVLIAAKICDYSGDKNIRLAVAIELVHTASLIHDDVIDNAAFRRGTATINSRWGNKVSILVGDYLFSIVLDLLATDGVLEIMRNITATTCQMTNSEMTQTLCQNDANMTEQRYLSIIAGKTASLISCSCRVGAMLGEVHNGEVDILGDYGRNLGMAFQMTDDLLDFTGDGAKLGKSPGNDIREGKLTLPFIYTMSEAGQADRQWMTDVFTSGRIDDESLARMTEIVRDCGGIDYTIEKAKQYGSACKDALKLLQQSQCSVALVNLADYVAQRAC